MKKFIRENSAKKNILLRKQTPPTNAFNWVLRSLSQSALGKFTTINLAVKFTRESPKHSRVTGIKTCQIVQKKTKKQETAQILLRTTWHLDWKRSKSCSWLARKIFFLANQRGGLARRLCRLLTRTGFLIDRGSCFARGSCFVRLVESFRKKIFKEVEEVTSWKMGARKQFSSINFHGGLIEGIS